MFILIVPIAVAALILLLIYFKPWILWQAEDRKMLVQTEIRLRKSGSKIKTPLWHYDLDELLLIERKMREIKSKRKLRYRLLPDEKELLEQFPYSYRYMKKGSRKP